MVGVLLFLALTGPRVLSADYCADQFALALADRGQIAALSVDAEKDFSYLRDQAAGLRQTRAEAEAAVASRADVVLRFWGGDAARFERLGLAIVTLDYAADFEGVKANIRKTAIALGQIYRGEALIDETDRRLAVLAARGAAHQSALYVTPGGVTAGKGTMIDAILNAAGVGNVAAEQGLSYWPALSAEALIADPPEFIVTGFFSSGSERVNHWSATRHPALKNTLGGTARIDLPADVLACPAWFSLDAAEAIRDRVDAMKAGSHE
ncbi:MAG: ABC transporter substrate-binding protein [Pseudomonadota bacterium]